MSDKTLRQAVDLWIAANDARLSPATVRGYIAIRDNGFTTLMGMRCGAITAKVVERAINTECKHYKAKTVVNRWIHVRGAVVPDRDHQLTRKETNKNSSSRRDVPIIEPLYQALQAVPDKTGPVVRVHPATMLAQINRACRDAGVPEVGCHGLRHFFDSLCHILNIPPAVAMQIGGWSDRATMDRIYTHVSKRTRDSYANAFTHFFTKQKTPPSPQPKKPEEGVFVSTGVSDLAYL